MEVRVRRLDKQGSDDLGWQILSRAESVYVALEGNHEPLLRPLHTVVVGEGDDRRLIFHGAPTGERLQGVGRRAVVMAHESVARLSSTFGHPEKACPATTLYRSASAHGVLAPLDDLAERAEVLPTLTVRFQPEGGFRTITADDPLYRASVVGTGVWVLSPDRVVSKVALHQGKRPEHRRRLVQWLWDRGHPGDARAAQQVAEAAPLDPPPDLLRGPSGTTLVLAADGRHVEGAVALLRHEYWNTGVSDADLRAAALGSPAWMVLETDGEVLATARAISDGHKTSYVADVAVRPDLRGQGLGRFLVQRLMAHPCVRHTRVDLMTRDSGRFYAELGFTQLAEREIWRFSPRF